MKEIIDRVGAVSLVLFAVIAAMVGWFVFVGVPGFSFWESAAIGAMILGASAWALGESNFMGDDK